MANGQVNEKTRLSLPWMMLISAAVSLVMTTGTIFGYVERTKKEVISIVNTERDKELTRYLLRETWIEQTNKESREIDKKYYELISEIRSLRESIKVLR